MPSLRHVLSIFNLMGMIRSDKLIDKLVADVVLALYQRCTLKDDISYLLPT